MAKSAKLPPILSSHSVAKLHHQSSIQLSVSTNTFNINKYLFKLNEQIFVLNKFKIDNLDQNYNAYVTIFNLLSNLNLFEKQEKLDLINWNIFRGLMSLFVDIIKLCCSNFKYLTINSSLFYNLPNLYTKKAFDSLNDEPRRIIMCSNTLKILFILIVNSRELKFKLDDLNGLDELLKLINDDSFLKTNEKHKCLVSALLIIYNLSIDYKKKPPLEYGHILLKFNKVDDVTAYIRCKTVLNFFPNNELFEERIGTKVTLFLKVLKKSYASPIKAEINSIFFIYSALKEVKYKSKLSMLILDENCLQIFLIKLSELSFLCNKFVYPSCNNHLDQKLLPTFDSNQNMNNAYRTIYYSYVFYQLLYLNGDYYQKLPSKAKYYVTKSLSSFLSNKEFLKNFSIISPSTIIDLEKCLLCLHTLNDSNHNHFDINLFEILLNIGNNYDTCSKESVLILSKMKFSNKLTKVLDKFIINFNEDSNQISNLLSSNKIYNCLFLLYTLLEEKLNKQSSFDLGEDFDRLILNDKYQKSLNEILKFAIKSSNLKINEIHLNKYCSSKDLRQNHIIYYLVYLNWFTLSQKCNISDSSNNYLNLNLNMVFDTYLWVLSSHQTPNYTFQLKLTQSIIIILKLTTKFNYALLQDSKKFEFFNNILYDLVTDISNDNSSININTANTCSKKVASAAPLNKEPLLKCQIIDDIITILIKIIENDAIQNFLNFYLKFLETHLIDLKFKSFKSENLIKIFHIKENEYLNVYQKYKQTSTYNLLILSEYFRNHFSRKKFESTLKLVLNLKELFLNDEIFLIEKKYIIDVLSSLILNEHCQVDTINNDFIFIDKLKAHLSASQQTLAQSARINLKDELGSRNREAFKFSIRKLLSHACQELIWLISDDFNFNLNLDKQSFSKPLINDKNILILYASECIKDSFKIRDELEKNNYIVNADLYDDLYETGDINLNEKNKLDQIKRLIDDNAIIIVCMVEKYKKTKYGTLGAKYAHLKHKTIISIKMTKNFELNDWMVNLNRAENIPICIDMSIYKQFSDFFDKLMSTIKSFSIRNFTTSILLPADHEFAFRNIDLNNLTSQKQNASKTPLK